METIKMNDTQQSFNGEVFYLCGSYFQHKGKRLHRTVWEYHNGTIPKGYHVHHKDEDRSKNDISDLELKTAHKHLSEHMNTEDRKEQGRKTIEQIRYLACIWHGSEEGLEWHSKQGKDNYKKRVLQTYICSQCGKEFQTLHVYGKGNHFCHSNCKAKYRRERVKRGEITK